MKIKNWDKYQLYKHKSMPWFKVYGTLLNDRDWHGLSFEEKATLLELWCLGSEDKGNLPEIEDISFRLRQPIDSLKNIIVSLLQKDWLVTDTVSSEYPESTLEEKRLDKKRLDKKIIDNKRGDKNGHFNIISL